MIPLSAPLVAALNAQMNRERSAEAAYRALASAAETAAVSLPGFRHFFKHSAKEESKHARKFEHFLIDRATAVGYAPTDIPAVPAAGAPLEWAKAAVAAAAALEASVTDSIDDLYDLAEAEGDAATCIFLHWFIMEQVASERELFDLATALASVDCDAALKLVDKSLK